MGFEIEAEGAEEGEGGEDEVDAEHDAAAKVFGERDGQQGSDEAADVEAVGGEPFPFLDELLACSFF